MSGRPVADPYLRVSDVERSEVADELKRHCADGRLDQAEFEARIDRTLRAKTRADLSGLLDDLPRGDPMAPGAYRRSRGPAGPAHRSTVWTLLLIGFIVVAGFSVLSRISHLTSPHIPWVVVLIAVAVIWRRHGGFHRY